MKKILIADDERAFRELISARLQATRCKILEATTGTGVLLIIEKEGPFDAILLDIMKSPGPQSQPHVKGFDCGLFVLRTLLQSHPETLPTILVVTVRDDDKLTAALHDMHIQNWCTKSTDDVEQIAAKLMKIAGFFENQGDLTGEG
jgi:CheY-like chemotaxis protein